MSENYLLNLEFTIAFVIIVSIYAMSTLTSFIKNKDKMALYLSLIFISQLIFLVMQVISNLLKTSLGANTLSTNLSTLGQIFIVFSMIMSLLFYGEFSEIPKRIKMFGIILGIFVMIWFIIPSNYAPTIEGKFHFRNTSFLFETIYSVIIYAFLSKQFYNLYVKTVEQKKEMMFLLVGNILWIFYFFWKLIQVFALLGIDWASIVSYLIYIVILTCYFLGIYYPKLKRKS